MDSPAAKSASDPAQWVDLHADALYRFALPRVRDPNVAEELVQETFCAALEARDRYSGRAAERTWLVGILKHKIVDHFRRSTRERPEDAPELQDAVEEEFFDSKGRWKVQPGDWGQSPERALERNEFWSTLRYCMGHLPERLRQVFALREIDGIETQEVCKVMGITSTNLWVMMHRARNQLRHCLEINWFDAEGGPGPT